MMEILIRLLLVVVFIGVALASIRGIERRRRRTESVFRPGLTLVVGPGCALCAPAKQALEAAGAVPEIVDVRDTPTGLKSLSLPIAIVTNREGVVVMQRSGRSVIVDAPQLATSAAEVVQVVR
jgi:hypothetical protein